MKHLVSLEDSMTYGILFEKVENGQLPPGFYYAHMPALGLTTHGEGIEGGARGREGYGHTLADREEGRG